MSKLINSWVGWGIEQNERHKENEKIKGLVLNELENKLSTHKWGNLFFHGSRAKVANMLSLQHINTPDISNSDWDFAVQDSGKLQRYLHSNWTYLDVKTYIDNDTVAVFEKKFGYALVQVSLRVNIIRYADCFNSVDEGFYFKNLHKSSPACMPKEDQSDFWNSLYYAWDMGNQNK